MTKKTVRNRPPRRKHAAPKRITRSNVQAKKAATPAAEAPTPAQRLKFSKAFEHLTEDAVDLISEAIGNILESWSSDAPPDGNQLMHALANLRTARRFLRPTTPAEMGGGL